MTNISILPAKGHKCRGKGAACGRHGGKDLPLPCQQAASSLRVCSAAETHILQGPVLPGRLVTGHGGDEGLAISA